MDFQRLAGPRNVSVRLEIRCTVIVSVSVWHTRLSPEK